MKTGNGYPRAKVRRMRKRKRSEQSEELAREAGGDPASHSGRNVRGHGHLESTLSKAQRVRSKARAKNACVGFCDSDLVIALAKLQRIWFGFVGSSR